MNSKTHYQINHLICSKQSFNAPFWVNKKLYFWNQIEGQRCLSVFDHQGLNHLRLPQGHEPTSLMKELQSDLHINENFLTYINAKDQRLYRWHFKQASSAPEVLDLPVKKPSQPRYHPHLGFLWMEQSDPNQNVELYHWQSPGSQGSVINCGHQYCRCLTVSPGGKAAVFLAWDRPTLPWHNDHLYLYKPGTKSAPRSISQLLRDSGTALIGFQNLTWINDHAFVFSARNEDWESLYYFDTQNHELRTLTEPKQSYTRSIWGAMEPQVVYHHLRKSIIAIAHRRGRSWLQELDLSRSQVASRDIDFQEFSQLNHLCASQETPEIAFIGSSSRRPSSLVTYDLHSQSLKLIDQAIDAQELNYFQARLQDPQSWEWNSYDGYQLYGWFYQTPFKKSSPPPCLVPIHGGPFQEVSAGWPLKAHYFNQLGYAVAYPNFRGSRGHGNHYCDSLEGRWGEIDCEDVASGVENLVQRGWVDPERIILWGGGVGARTVLQVLARYHDLFAAGIVVYGFWNLGEVLDKQSLSQLDYYRRLIGINDELDDGRIFENADLSRLYSHVKKPIGIFHGKQDPLISWRRSEDLAISLAQNKVPCVTHFYENAGHGWAEKDLLMTYYQDVEDFLEKVVKS